MRATLPRSRGTNKIVLQKRGQNEAYSALHMHIVLEEVLYFDVEGSNTLKTKARKTTQTGYSHLDLYKPYPDRIKNRELRE